MGRQLPDHRRTNTRFPVMHGANTREQLLAGSVFEQVALSACPQRAIEVFLAVVGCQDDHPGRGPLVPDRANGADPVEFWHAEVHEGDVGLMVPEQLYGLSSVMGLSDHR